MCCSKNIPVSVPCPTCGGAGYVPAGFFNYWRWPYSSTTSAATEPCRTCRGARYVQVDACSDCRARQPIPMCVQWGHTAHPNAS